MDNYRTLICFFRKNQQYAQHINIVAEVKMPYEMASQCRSTFLILQLYLKDLS